MTHNRTQTRETNPRHEINPMPFFNVNFERSEALLATQKDLLEAYERAVQGWLARAQTEAAIWSELPAKMAGSESVPKALEAYGNCVSRQMQMSVEDGQRLFDDWRQIARRLVNSPGSRSGAGRG